MFSPTCEYKATYLTSVSKSLEQKYTHNTIWSPNINIFCITHIGWATEEDSARWMKEDCRRYVLFQESSNCLETVVQAVLNHPLPNHLAQPKALDLLDCMKLLWGRPAPVQELHVSSWAHKWFQETQTTRHVTQLDCEEWTMVSSLYLITLSDGQVKPYV